MAETTGIQWTDHTFNMWRGCTKISPGGDPANHEPCELVQLRLKNEKGGDIAEWPYDLQVREFPC